MSDEIIDSRVERVFNCALRFDSNKRKKYLERACKGQPALRLEVDSLLETAANSSDFLLGLSQRISRLPVFEPISTNELPTKIGAWNLLSLLGEGGMGRVYKVARDDGQYHQLAALKILPISASDEMSKYRFRAERQILAALNHKNIVQLLDGGVTQEGVPYFVMEYVDGVPIDQYCQNVGLDFRERLNLFLDICNAVQYAHDNMVIHRDLKPNNILINNNGEVKLLDFGIAKFLGGSISKNDATSPAFRHLTPAYASPQMLRGENVDVKTDVYSLGVVLYKLLSGVKPYNNCENAAQLIKGHHETRAETIMPSLAAPTKQMRRMLSGDLDNIARKALSVSVDERYHSVASFANDIHAYLNGFPVAARSGGLLYKIRRFITRNLYAAILSCLVMLALFVFAYFYIRKNNEAELQATFANYQQQRAMLSNDFITVLLNEIGLEDKPMSEEGLLQLAEDFVLKQAEFSPTLSGWLMFDISLKYGLVARGDDGNYLMKKASQLMLQAEDIAKKQQDNDLLRAVLCMQAHRDFYANPGEAIKKINMSVRLTVKDTFSVESTIACAIAEAKKYEYLGESELALRKINKNIENFSLHHSPYSTLYFKLFNAKGLVLYRRNRFEEAFNTNGSLLDMLKQAGHEKSRYYLTLEGNRALVLEAMGDLKRATDLREEMIRKASGQIKDSLFMKNIWMDHVFCLTRQGRHQEAAIIFQREFGGLKTQRAWGLTLSREINLHISYAYHLAVLGQLEQANSRLNVARDLLASLADRRSKLRRYLYIDFVETTLLRKSGFEGKSGALMREMLGKITDLKGGFRGFLMLAYYQGVKMRIDHGEYVEAERDALYMLSNALRNAGEDGESGDVGLARLVLAQIYQKRRQHERALENFSRAVTALRQGYGRNHPFSIEASIAFENYRTTKQTIGNESVNPL